MFLFLYVENFKQILEKFIISLLHMNYKKSYEEFYL